MLSLYTAARNQFLGDCVSVLHSTKIKSMNDEVKRKERLNEIRWNGREMRKEKQSEKVKEQEKKKVKFNVSIQ